MKRHLSAALSLVAAATLSACGPHLMSSLPPPPATIAETTTMDEKTSLAIEVLYRGLGGLLEAAIDGGRLKGEAATRADRLDAKLLFYVSMARAAYDAGNAESYATALRRARPIAAELKRIVAQRP